MVGESQAGRILLLWDSNPYYEQVTSYAVYSLEAGQQTLVGHVQTNRAVVLDAPAGTNCYVITAINAYGESDPSVPLCLDVKTGSLNGSRQLDKAAPQSRVADLPDQVDESFEVSWMGEDEPGGSGVNEFDVYVSENGGPFMRWLRGTKESKATFRGQQGVGYGFYTVASDVAGNRETPPGLAQAQTRTRTHNTPPWFQGQGGFQVDVGYPVSVLANAYDLEVPRLQKLTYSLVASEGTSAAVDPETGTLSWTPTPIYAGKTLRFAVRASDNGEPSMSATQEVAMVVRDYFEIELGSGVVRSGTSAMVPVRVFSSQRAWKLSFNLHVAGAALADMEFVPDPSRICMADVTPLGEGRQAWRIEASACASGSVRTFETVGHLRVDLQERTSAVVPLSMRQLEVLTQDDRPIVNKVAHSGRLVFLSDRPVLDLQPMQDGIAVYLYGRPGSAYLLELDATGGAQPQWQPVWSGTLAKDYERFFIPTTWSSQAFFRVQQLPGSP